jgi:hypothetical protein
MAYDPATSQVVLFGGMGKTNLSSATWAWDGSDWSKLSPATSPPPRYGATMFYDGTAGGVVLFTPRPVPFPPGSAVACSAA